MLKLRTKLLLLAIAVFGIGIGVLAGIADGAYSAICLFVLPVLVALAAASIVSDFNSPNTVKTNAATWERPRFAETPAALDIPATAWTKPVLQDVTRVDQLMSEAKKITAEMYLPDIVQSYPASRLVFDRYGLQGCGGPNGPSRLLKNQTFFPANDHGQL